jgi:hypothetical protein
MATLTGRQYGGIHCFQSREKSMKPENNPDSNSNPTDAETSDQERDNALKNFMHPEDKPKIQQKSWIKTNLTRLLIVGGIIVICGVGADIYVGTRPPKIITIPSTFDVSALKSYIGANDSVMMPIDNYTASAPPIFDTQTEIMTVPVPIVFDSSDIPNLTVEKLRNNADNSLNIIEIGGLEPGETLFSPFDGDIIISPGAANMDVFFLEITDYQEAGIAIEFSTPDGVNPSINFNLSATATEDVEIPVVKNQPIGNIIGTSIQAMGTAPLLKTFNLGVSGGKVILLTK